MKIRTKKRLVAFAIVLILLLVLVPVALAWPFGDVPAGYWAYNSIRRIALLHISAGCGGGNYCPDDYVTRAQMAGFLNNLTRAWTDEDEEFIFSVDHRDIANDRPAIISRSADGDGVRGISYGGGVADNGVYGETNSGDSQEAGVHGVSTADAAGVIGSSTGGAGGYFEAPSFHPDVVLGGPGSGDDGDLWSDPNKGSSDIFLISNDEVWIDLDEDNTENAAFIIMNGENDEVFKVDESTGWYGDWSGSQNDVQIRTRDDVELYLDTTNDSTGVWRLMNTAGNEVIWGREDGDGYFRGDLGVGGAKPAVVQTASYGSRRLYCMESPELWFEDFGTGQLEDGRTKVAIDPLFAETVNLDLDYHVYLTPISDQAVLLFVVAKTNTGFEVQGVTLDGSPSTASFDYRLVAKRLGYEDRRLDAWDPISEAGASPGPTMIPDLGDEPRVPGESMTFRLATPEEDK